MATMRVISFFKRLNKKFLAAVFGLLVIYVIIGTNALPVTDLTPTIKTGQFSTIEAHPAASVLQASRFSILDGGAHPAAGHSTLCEQPAQHVCDDFELDADIETGLKMAFIGPKTASEVQSISHQVLEQGLTLIHNPDEETSAQFEKCHASSVEDFKIQDSRIKAWVDNVDVDATTICSADAQVPLKANLTRSKVIQQCLEPANLFTSEPLYASKLGINTPKDVNAQAERVVPDHQARTFPSHGVVTLLARGRSLNKTIFAKYKVLIASTYRYLSKAPLVTSIPFLSFPKHAHNITEEQAVSLSKLGTDTPKSSSPRNLVGLPNQDFYDWVREHYFTMIIDDVPTRVWFGFTALQTLAECSIALRHGSNITSEPSSNSPLEWARL